MAIVAPFIAAGIGLTGTAALIGEAVIGVGLSLGAGYLSSKLSPQPSSQSNPGMRLFVSYETNAPRQVAMGIVADAGEFKYHNEYGPNGNDYVQFVYKLADEPCTSLEGVYVNGVAVTLGSKVTTTWASGRTVAEYPNAMWIEFHNGDWNQDADADLVGRATGGEWKASYRGRGVCYVRVTMKFNAKLYKAGRPNFLFIYKGGKRYDWRKDSTAGGSGSHRWGDPSTYEWTRNAQVNLYNWKRGIYVGGEKLGGMNVPASSMPVDVWTAGANACDETVTRKDGSTEMRYAVDGLIPVNAQNAIVVRDMIAAMAAVPGESGGVFKFYPGVAQAPVLEITDGDLTSLDDVTFAPKQSRSSLVNAVFGSFSDPSQLYKETDLPPRVSPDDLTEDGGTPLTKSYALKYVTSGTQGQRILEIFRRRGRFQRNLTLKIGAIGAILESGDWITWTSRRYGFSNMSFIVVQATLNRDFTISLELQETSESIYEWDAETNELDPLNPHDVGPGGEKFSVVTGVAVAPFIYAGDGGAQIPALGITWDAVTDPTVISLQLEYRQVGDTVAISENILDPTTGGVYSATKGVQGNLGYEARLRPVTLPERATTWSGWVSADDDSPPQIVDVAASALSVPPDTISAEMLTAQARHELSMATGLATLQGSVNERIQVAIDMARQAASAAMGIAAQQQMLIQSVRAQADGNTIGVTETLQAIADLNDGLQAQWTVAIDVNGNVKGIVQLFSDVEASQFSVLADRIVFCLPDGTGAKQVFTVGLLADGSTGVGIDANQVIIRGSIKAQHIDTVSLGTISITDPGNTSTLNLQTMSWRSTDGKRIFDMKNGILDWTF